MTHETDGPEGKWMVVRHDALAVEGGGDRDLEALGEAAQRITGTGAGRAVTGEDDYLLGRRTGADEPSGGYPLTAHLAPAE
jgi:hypothetical protein